MKVKNNTKNLIPRKLIGGLIPKFESPFAKIARKAGRVARGIKNVVSKHPIRYSALASPGVPVVAKPFIALSIKDSEAKRANAQLQEAQAHGYNSVAEYKNAIRKDEQHRINVERSHGVPVTGNPKADNAFKRYQLKHATQGKPAGTNGNTKGSGTRGKARTTAKPAATTTTSTVTPTNNVPNGMEYASDYLNANTPNSALSAYNTLALNVLSDVDKRIAEIRPTISSRSAYADMEDAMSGWDLKRKLKMMDASVGTAWDWNTEEGRKNFVGMANLMKNGKGNYNKIYDQWMASLPKTNESQNETYALRFPLAYQSGLLTTPITDNLSLTTQLPVSTNQPSIGWVNTLAILDAVNRTIPQLSIGNTNNNDFAALESPQKNFSGFVTDLFKRKKTGNWTFAKQGTKLIRRK